MRKLLTKSIAAMIVLVMIIMSSTSVLALDTTDPTTTPDTQATTVAISPDDSTITPQDSTMADTQEFMPIAPACNGIDPRAASDLNATYSTWSWGTVSAACTYYNVPTSAVHSCSVSYGGCTYSYYVQMDSFRIYFYL